MGKNYRPGRAPKPETFIVINPTTKIAEGICKFDEERQLFAVRNTQDSSVLLAVEEQTTFEKVKVAIQTHPAYPKQEQSEDDI